jgi:dipeptidyl aminopeptidase/acylaminoacyl peptidase
VGSQGTVNLEGVLFQPQDADPDVVFLMMHPSSTLQLLPLPTALAQAGHAVLCMGSRYAKNDSALIYEKVVLDLGACVRHAKERLGFKRVVLLGWSGGGALSLLYQS